MLISTVAICVIAAWFGLTFLVTELFPFVPSGEGPR
jgi:hypothetical protein